MNTEFSDDEMVELLRGAAQVLPGTRAEHVAAAGTVGRKLRRRRRATSMIGAGTAGLVVVVGVTALGLTGNGTQSVVQSAAPAGDDPAPQPAKPGDGLTAEEQAKAEAAGLSPEEFAAASEASAARKANVQLLLARLGPDFRLRGPEESGLPVTVREGSNAASALPEGWTGGASISTSEDGSFLADRCKPGQEKGLTKSACTVVEMANGRTVYVQRSSFSVGTDSPSTTEGLRYYFGRPDGSVVQILFEASTLGGAGQPTRDEAVAWLGGYKHGLTALAADERVEPKPTTTGKTPPTPVISSHDNDLVTMQRALGINFNVLDGKLMLEPNWPLYRELPTLPHGYWTVLGDITSISRSAFDAACTAKAGLAACEKRTVDGNEVYVRTWADQDAKSEFVGESAAYFPRPDGQVLLANLDLSSKQIDPSSSAKVAGVKEWLQALESKLIATVTDPSIKG